MVQPRPKFLCKKEVEIACFMLEMEMCSLWKETGQTKSNLSPEKLLPQGENERIMTGHLGSQLWL